MKEQHIHRFKTIAEFHTMAGLPGPEHPLVSLVDYSKVVYQTTDNQITWVQDFYSIGLKRNLQGKIRYGQQPFDFDEGIMTFVAPGQVLSLELTKQDAPPSGWLLLLHPDFLWKTPLATTIRQYDFFGYDVNEALFLSEKEETILTELMRNIEKEYHSNIDNFSQSIIIAQVELLLTYSERYYQRQFITRKISNHRVLEQMEQVLDDYFAEGEPINTGLPTVQYVAGKLNISPNYLGSLLKTLTNKTTRQHIHDKIIDKAREKLTSTQMTVSEIAYELGFEHPQSFSKFFKANTNQSPLEFRSSFN